MLAKRVSPSGVSILQHINFLIFIGDTLIKLHLQQRFVLFEFLFDPVVSATQVHTESILDITDDDWVHLMHVEESHEGDAVVPPYFDA